MKLCGRILKEDGKFSLNRKKIHFIRKTFSGDNHELMSKVFSVDENVFPTTKLRMIDFINYYGADNLYVGYRSNYNFKAKTDVENFTYLIDLARKSVFKHDKYDQYYYDLLDGNAACKIIQPDMFFLNDGCSDMKSVQAILENKDYKVRRYLNDTKAKRL